ncbi:MAG: hypothetical protein KAI79_12405 [Bacteroidales bacterium]|nr:hypothetical protein [Bacteroidales bacterium]
MKIIGIHDGHNASVCLMVDGVIKYLIQEERLVKEKNKMGFPFKSLELVLKESGLNSEDIDCIGLNGEYMPKPLTRMDVLENYKKLLENKKYSTISKVKNKLKTLKIVSDPFEQLNKEKRISTLEKLGFKKEKIQFLDHHMLHASSAYYGNANFMEDILVLTNDGAGDKICASVSLGKKGKLERIETTSDLHSVASMYAIFTFLTGMVPMEHEYKLMGMAPYADKKGVRKIADEFWNMFEFQDNGLSWEFKKGKSVFSAIHYFKDFMFLKRFDHLMGGLQLFVEEFLAQWVRNAILSTGVNKVVCAGGIFMNVKANKVLLEMDEIEELFIYPSCGDESNAAGICYYLENKMNGLEHLKPLEDVYFGVSFKNDIIKNSFEAYNFENYKYRITQIENIESKVATILADGNVLARFRGREEFGARSLGNRAILANPSNADVIKEINQLIKNRDFWMPFASSILDEDMDKYIDWEQLKHKILPYYMIMTYDTKPIAHTEISGGIHPYDKTVRPQMVTKEHNQDYWNLIKEFKNITGIGGLLNTSLNLHGLPLVYEPEDAFHVMENSNLKYLAIENWLIEKI